jgi:hypothetical protein
LLAVARCLAHALVLAAMSRLRHVLVVSAALLAGAVVVRNAHANGLVGAPAPSTAPQGILVLAAADAADAAWPLAQGVYASAALRPRATEAEARVLAGERAAAPDDATRELGELCDGVKGEDAASRQVLSSIAQRFGAKGVVVVAVAEGRARARLFVAQTGAFDAARYDAEGDPRAPLWKGVVASLERAFPPPAPASAPTLAAKPAVPPPSKAETSSGKPFYLSWWFWGAVGAAAVTGLVVFAATRDQDSSNIHLTLEMPK